MTPAPQVTCDLCESQMMLPDHCRRTGQVIGLLVCTLCIEDQLQSRVGQCLEVA